MMARTVTVLPEPDSPTIAIVSPLNKSIRTPRIAFTLPEAVSNEIFRSRIDNTLSFLSLFADMETPF